jgi:hypothetical protein
MTEADYQKRIDVFKADSAWLRARRGIFVWCYWYTTGSSGTNWRMLDSASQTAWKNLPR